MPPKLDSISRFSPGNCSSELLETMLVGQHELVDRLEKAVLDGIETGAGHHWLLVGPRGTGKTHLLAILYNRINENPDIRDKVAIAYMKEEERGVAAFLDWVVRILRAFDRRDERPDPSEDALDLEQELVRLVQMPLDQAQTEAERLLLRFVGDKKLLLITENLGEIFSEDKGMGQKGQRKLRDMIQQYPFWTIMASTQALFEDIQTREGPFYGFFKIQHLSMFTFEQALELLDKLASAEGRNSLKAFFRSEAGQGRIRAIHEITGGNPRLLVIFYQFVDRESIEDLSGPFLEMVDNLTSYYQEQMQPLPALQQKIVEFLCERRSPATVKEIAQSCFVKHQIASTQLKRLTVRRYVQSTRVGREAYYELREPLFRICFEVKENMGYPIRLFIDFLGRFYSVEELKRKHKNASLLMSLHQAHGLETERFEEAIEYYRKAIKLEPDNGYPYFNIALALFQSGNLEAGLEQVAHAVAAGKGRDWAEPIVLCVNDINVHLLSHAPLDSLPGLIEAQREIFEKGSFSESFTAGMIGALTEALKPHHNIPYERLDQLRETVIPELAKEEGLSVACRLFDTGVRYLEKRDIRVLLELPLEERTKLQGMLGQEERET